MEVVYEFCGLRLDPQRRRLSRQDGEAIVVAPRLFDALYTLVRQPGELVEKGALMHAIWPAVTVSENSVDQIISRLRRVVGDGGAGTSFISTERGRGYRLLADVKIVATNAVVAAEGHATRLYRDAVTLSLRPGPDNLRAAFEALQQALALSPGFATALAYRALLRTVFVAFDIPMQDALVLAEKEARQALEIDPTLAYGHHAVANVAVAKGAWNEAANHYETASRLEQEPHARLSRVYQLLQPVGHLRKARIEAERVDCLAAQPLASIAATTTALLLGDDFEAREQADRACALGWPRTHPVLQDVYFMLAIREGRFCDAAESVANALGASMRAAGAMEAIQRLCEALSGPAGRDTAHAALSQLIARIPDDEFGLIDRKRVVLWLTMIGALDEAFDLANASLDHFARSGTVGAQWGMLWMAEMRPFRCDARFEQFVARLRLPDYWRRHGPPDEVRE
jgi:DNA-binding winged helix-turn-helix (wHTH) protein